MFSMGEIRAVDLEYGMRSSPWWIPMLLFLIFLVPMTIYITVLFPSWNELRRTWGSFLAVHAGETKTKIISALHWHPHPKLR